MSSVLAGLKLLRDVYKLVRDMRMKLSLCLNEVKRCEALIMFIQEASIKYVKLVRNSTDASLVKGLIRTLERSRDTTKRVEPLVRRKKRMLEPLDALIGRITSSFSTVQKTMFVANMSIKACLTIVEKSFTVLAKTAARRLDGGIEQLEQDLRR